MKAKLKKGFVQVYTGNGKGKSTAAFGLAMRAVGAGLRVFIAQFLKRGNYSEIKAIKQLKPTITVQQFGTGRFVMGKPSELDVNAVRMGIKAVQDVIRKRAADLVIMDEINTVVSLKIISVKAILSLIAQKPVYMEIVLTGRNAPSALLKKADLITEMKEIKHYYKKGIKARRGIEF